MSKKVYRYFFHPGCHQSEPLSHIAGAVQISFELRNDLNKSIIESVFEKKRSNGGEHESFSYEDSKQVPGSGRGLVQSIGASDRSQSTGNLPGGYFGCFLKLCHAQSCGKCTPCRIGLGQLENLLEQVLDGEADEETLILMEKTARAIEITADCAIRREAARMVLAGIKRV